MSLEEEVASLRAENSQLKEQLRLALEQLGQALARIKQLEGELEQAKSAPTSSPSFVKPSTPKPKDNKDNQSRRKRAKEHNGARRREQTPTRTVEHYLDQCPDCGYSLRQHQLAGRRQV